jgi:hypothetical protein
LCKQFEKNGFKLTHFVAPPGGPVMPRLKSDLRLAPFAVADLTELNPNVLIEVGMAQMLDKPLMLLRKKDDPQALPFDIQGDQVDIYEVRGEDTFVLDSGSGGARRLEDRVDEFIDRLQM